MDYVKSLTVSSGGTLHIQGIAIDEARQYMYISFTTMLLKVDLHGNVIGSVTGLVGHLGCIAYNPADGRVYGSLEFKNDSIGRGILREMGLSEAQIADCFYIARFDVDKITAMDMDCEKDGIMTAVCLKEVCDDYSAAGHRYGCSGIDGTTFAPAFGSSDGRLDLYVAYGIYGDVSRTDNDHQVILRYDVSGWDAFAKPLNQRSMHRSGPVAPDGKYFVFTGNTTWGIQNLEYDPYTDTLLTAVYPGQKPQFPNHPMFFIDHAVPPVRQVLQGWKEEGALLSLADRGNLPGPIPGSDFPYGSTGIIALGDGFYYVSEPFVKDGIQCSTIRLYRFEKDTGKFIPVE